MNLTEWIKHHQTKSAKRCQDGSDLLHPCVTGNETLWTDSENGACQFVTQRDTVFVTGIVGNLKHWENKLHEYGEQNKIVRFVGYTCANNPQAVARVLGMKINRVWFELERGLGRECASRQLPKQQ